MGAIAEGAFQRQTIGDTIRSQFAQWEKNRQLAKERKREQPGLLVQEYTHEVDIVQENLTPFVVSIETAICESEVKTPEIKDARSTLSAMVADTLIQEAWSTILQTRFNQADASALVIRENEFGQLRGQVEVLSGGIRTPEEIRQLKMRELIADTFEHFEIGAANSWHGDGKTTFAAYHDAIADLVAQKNPSLSVRAVKADLIAATSGYALDALAEKNLPPSMQSMLEELTLLLDDSLRNGSVDRQREINSLWRRLQSQTRAFIFEQRQQPIDFSQSRRHATRSMAAETVFKAKSLREQVALRRAMDDQRGVDWFTRLSYFGVRAAGSFFLLSMILSACGGGAGGGGTSVPIPTDTPKEDSNHSTGETTSGSSMQKAYTAPDFTHTIQLAYASAPPIELAAGTHIAPAKDPVIQSFNDHNLAPIFTTDDELCIIGTDPATGRSTAFVPSLEEINSSTVAGAALEDRSFDPALSMWVYTDAQGLAPGEEIIGGYHLPIALPDGIGCALAIVRSPQLSWQSTELASFNVAGTVVFTLFSVTSDGQIDPTQPIFMTDAGFAQSSAIVFKDGQLIVDGQPQPFFDLATKSRVESLAAALQLSSIATSTATSTAIPTLEIANTATATPEQLGGDKVAVIIPDFDSRLSKDAIVALIEPYINAPTKPDVWPTKLGDFMIDNGVPIKWSDHFIMGGADNSLWAEFPALLRGVIEINDPVANGTLMISIYEIPAAGGSNFLVSIDQDNANSRRAGQSIYDLNNPLPTQWFVKGTIIDSKTLRDISNSSVVNSKVFIETISDRIDKIIIIRVPITGESIETTAFNKILNGELLSSQNIVEAGVKIMSAILP